MPLGLVLLGFARESETMTDARMPRWMVANAAAVMLLVVSAPTRAAEPPASAQAAEPLPGGPSLGALVGASLFVQEGHAPPLCCNERDHWSVIGPKVGIRGGWGFGEYFELTVDLRFGMAYGSSNQYGEERDNQVRTFDMIGGGNLRLPVGIVSITLGGGAGASHISGEFSTVPGESSSTSLGVAVALQGRLGVEVRVLPTFSLGIEASAMKHLIVTHDFTTGLTATYRPGPL